MKQKSLTQGEVHLSRLLVELGVASPEKCLDYIGPDSVSGQAIRVRAARDTWFDGKKGEMASLTRKVIEAAQQYVIEPEVTTLHRVDGEGEPIVLSELESINLMIQKLSLTMGRWNPTSVDSKDFVEIGNKYAALINRRNELMVDNDKSIRSTVMMVPELLNVDNWETLSQPYQNWLKASVKSESALGTKPPSSLADMEKVVVELFGHLTEMAAKAGEPIPGMNTFTIGAMLKSAQTQEVAPVAEAVVEVAPVPAPETQAVALTPLQKIEAKILNGFVLSPDEHALHMQDLAHKARLEALEAQINK